MATEVIEHADIPNQHLHEPKDISSASSGEVYTADGIGGGSWEVPSIFVSSSAYPIGTVIPYGGTTEPTGWAFCYGQVLSRLAYSSLFSVIGVNYGIGDGSTTFALPDCRGRVSVGKDDMGGSAANRVTNAGSGITGTTLGSAGGSDAVTLVTNNIPPLAGTAASGGSHTHSVTNGTGKLRLTGGGVSSYNSADANFDPDYDEMTISTDGAHTHTVTVNSGVTPTAHNNVQPTIVVNMMIYHGVG